MWCHSQSDTTMFLHFSQSIVVGWLRSNLVCQHHKDHHAGDINVKGSPWMWLQQSVAHQANCTVCTLHTTSRLVFMFVKEGFSLPSRSAEQISIGQVVIEQINWTKCQFPKNNLNKFTIEQLMSEQFCNWTGYDWTLVNWTSSNWTLNNNNWTTYSVKYSSYYPNLA